MPASNLIPAAERGPVARVRTNGDARSLAIQRDRGSFFLWGGGFCYQLPEGAAQHSLAAVAAPDAQDGASWLLLEDDGRDARPVLLERHGDVVAIFAHDLALFVDAADLVRAVGRAAAVTGAGR